ncbi:helix-turn-helix domain-containing protein [Erythrobacter sp.]|uniref:helix-turn-helix domain-containing protein n=1 Tax=Erythrobacter sp. TaxID=1042 RepID=UPI00311E82A5
MPSAGTTAHLREQHHPALIEPIAMRVRDACRYLGIGRSTLYVLIGQGELDIVKLGSSTLILTASLQSLIERRREPRHNTQPDTCE